MDLVKLPLPGCFWGTIGLKIANSSNRKELDQFLDSPRVEMEVSAKSVFILKPRAETMLFLVTLDRLSRNKKPYIFLFALTISMF